MPRQNATPKQAGGGGFDFEDEVVAYFLIHLLAGLPPFERQLPHALSRVDVQEAASEWHLDDVLLTVETPEGPARVAVSVKSNDQFANGAFPDDFVCDAWEHLLQTSSTAFDRDRDWLALVTAPSHGVEADLNTLLDRARYQDPVDLAADLPLHRRANDGVRKLHDSAACPDSLAGLNATTPGEMLGRLIWMPFDLDHAPSARRARAKELAQSLVASGRAEDAETLWKLVKDAAWDLRKTSGDVDRETLVHTLRPHLSLRGLLAHRDDWDRIRQSAQEALRLVPHKIGGQIELPRTNEQQAVRAALSRSGAAVVLGASGVGKTVLARLLAQDVLARSDDPRVVWASDAHSGSLSASHGLHLPFWTLARHDARAGSLLVIDRIDRLYQPDAFQNAAALLHAVGLGSDEPDGPLAHWQVVLTCTPEAWDDVRERLLQHDVSPEAFEPVTVEAPAADELDAVWTAFPTLQPLRQRRHLSPVLLRPKVLDLLARKARLTLDLGTIGESHLATWFWETEIESGPAALDRGLAASALARHQGDHLAPDTAVAPDRFDSGQRAAIALLDTDRIVSVRNGRAAFEHDLYGDWVRLHTLRREAAEGTLEAFLGTRMQSPVWHRAVRLYGLYLIEQEGGLDAWRFAFDALGRLPGSAGTLARDLLLEACAHTDGSVSSLQALWPVLVEDDGVLLDRLLQGLLYSATLPNPVVVERLRNTAPGVVGADPGTDVYIASAARIPYGPYWYAPLYVLHARRGEIPTRAVAAVARVADLWLRFTPTGWPLREEAADVALTLAEALLKVKQETNWTFGDGEADRAVHRALLAASSVRTDGAVALLLEAAGRRDPRFQPPPASEEEIAAARARWNARGIPVSLGRRGDLEAPWPDGPARRVDEALQHVVLETDALLPLVAARPEAAKELLLALLLHHPRDRSSYTSPLGDYGFEYVSWHPPFYIRGPFRPFLAINEAQGTDAVLRLVRHATERRTHVLAEFDRESDRLSVPSTLRLAIADGERVFAGDSQAILWHLQGPDSHGVTASALMALERHLYDRIDAEDDVSDTVAALFREAQTVAELGLLATVGCYAPNLFKGPLRPLLTSPELLTWTRLGMTDDSWTLSLGSVMGHLVLSEALHDAYRTWHEMPHRRTSLAHIGLYYLVNDESFKATYAEARRRWTEQSAPGGRYEGWDEVETLIAQFDLDNYRPETMPSGEQALVFDAPQRLQDRAADAAQALAEDTLVLTVPLSCRQLLDAPESPVDVDALWATAERLGNLDADRWDGAPTSVLDAQAGIAAVLATHPDTLSDDQLAWTRARLLDASRAGRDGYGVALFSLEAQAFAADALPALWSRDHADADLRDAVAHMVTTGSSDLVARLAVSASQYRASLGDEHRRLLHFVLRHAHDAYELDRLDRLLRYGGLADGAVVRALSEAAHAARTRDADQTREAFVSGALEARVPPLSDVGPAASAWPRSSPMHAFRRDRLVMIAREDLLNAAFLGVPLPRDADEHRLYWTAVWQGAVADTAGRLATPNADPTLDAEGADGPWERFVWERAALLAASAATDDEARAYWAPILSLGPTASASVSTFLREWWRYAAGDPGNTTLHRRWGQMVATASRHPRWSRDDSHGRRSRAELWRLVVGLQHLSGDSWPETLVPLVQALAPHLQQWAMDHALAGDDLVSLATFLTFPAARPVRLDGLVWTDAALRSSGNTIWDEHVAGEGSRFGRLETAAAHALLTVWSDDEASLRRRPDAFAAFQSILSVLVGRQLPLALELSGRVGDG